MDKSAPASVKPKPASSIMLIRDGGLGLEVLMMRRSETMAFAPGAFVFPGGKVDESDTSAALWKRFISGRVTEDLGYRVAALRELFEEAGVLLMTERATTAPRPCSDFIGLVRRKAGKLNCGDLVPFAQWVTPEGLPRRYDTYFFLVPIKNVVPVKADGSEATEVKWVSPHRLLEDWEAGLVPLMFPTRLNLMKLAKAYSVREALSQAKASPPVKVLPRITQDGARREVVIPASAGFGVTAATPKELMVEAPVKR